jgi:hypothetical protein
LYKINFSTKFVNTGVGFLAMQPETSKIQTSISKNALLVLMLASSIGQWYYMTTKPTKAVEPEEKLSRENSGTHLIYLSLTESSDPTIPVNNNQASKKTEKHRLLNKDNISLLEQHNLIAGAEFIYLDMPDIFTPHKQEISSQKNTEIGNKPTQNNLIKPPELPTQIDDIFMFSSQSQAQLLEQPVIEENDGNVQKPTQESSPEEELPVDINEEQELRLRVRPRPQEELPPPPQEQIPEQFQPIGYLRGYGGYFHSSNIFASSDNKIQDSLYYTGLTLASAYFPLSPTTYINGSIDGSLIRYFDQSEFDYNQVRFNLGVYQQLTRKMYAELNLSNQRLFYARKGEFFAAGDRFLNENTVLLYLGRRDDFTDKLTLDTLYEFSANFSEPERRSRIVNSLWLSLGYLIQEPLQVGLNYQFAFSDFTQQEREDKFHRLFGHLNYRLSNTSNVYLQGGFNFGDSTTPNLDFSSWFLSVNYGFEIGRF